MPVSQQPVNSDQAHDGHDGGGGDVLGGGGGDGVDGERGFEKGISLCAVEDSRGER